MCLCAEKAEIGCVSESDAGPRDVFDGGLRAGGCALVCDEDCCLSCDKTGGAEGRGEGVAVGFDRLTPVVMERISFFSSSCLVISSSSSLDKSENYLRKKTEERTENESGQQSPSV